MCTVVKCITFLYVLYIGTLLKWKVQDSALFYVFQRPKVQMGLSSILDTTIEPLEHSEGIGIMLLLHYQSYLFWLRKCNK